MVINDWEKIQEGNFLVYHNKDTNSFLTVWKVYLNESTHIVRVSKNKQTLVDRKFKNKQLASKFAKAYMIKN